MKKIIFTVAAIFAFGFANAQDKKESTGEGFASGDVFIMGSAGFSNSSTGDFSNSTYNFSPRVGFFVSPNIALGVALGFNGSKEEDITGGGTTTEDTTTEFSIGAFGRYYFMPASKFSVFGELGFNVLSSKFESSSTNSGITISGETKANGFNVAAAPGVSYFVSDSFAFEAKWGLLEYRTTEPDAPAGGTSVSTDTFNFNLGFDALSIGLLYKF